MVYQQSNLQENCLYCAVGPTIAFPLFVGFPCLKIVCFHSNKKNKIKVTYSKQSAFIAVALSVFLLLSCVHSIYAIRYVFNKKDEMELGKLLTNALLCLRSLVCLCGSMLRTDYGRRMVVGLNDVIQTSECMGYGIFLPEKDVRRVRSFSMLICFVSYTFLIIFAVYMFLNISSKYLWLEEISIIICFCIDISVILLYWASTKIYATVHYRFRQELKFRILQRYRNPNLENVYREEYYQIFLDSKEISNIRDWLIIYMELHTDIFETFKSYIKFCDPLVVIVLIITVIVIIVNGFFTLLAIVNGNLNAFISECTGPEVQLYLSTFGLIYTLDAVQHLQNTVSLLVV